MKMKEEITEELKVFSNEESEVMDLFVGNLSLYTTEFKLQTYFSTFGTLTSVKICTHPENGKNKRFGFLNFESADVISKILNYPRHEIDGKILEIRYASKNMLNKRKNSVVKAKSPENEEVNPRIETSNKAKIFVGGVSQNAKVDDLRSYFSSFGPVQNVTLLPDHITGRHRGFGFVTFENESTAEVVCSSRYHTIKMKKVECKKASVSRATKSYSDTKKPLLEPPIAPPPTRLFPMIDPNNKSPGLLGEHPWQALTNTGTGGLLLNPYALYPSPFPFTPVYIDPCMSLGSPHHPPTLQLPSSSVSSYKVLNHRVLSDSSLRYSPYTLQGRIHSSQESSPYSPSAFMSPAGHHGTGGYQQPLLLSSLSTNTDDSVIKQSEYHHWGPFVPSRKI